MDYDVRVVDRPTAIKLTNLSQRTWARLEARGEAPPKTRLSANRTGYRLSDIKAWLDARRMSAAPGSTDSA
jgi:predicted DNA-binding transcriptional regulator AlpA